MNEQDRQKRRKWDNYFLDLSEGVAKKSKDPSTKVGAIIVGPDHEIRSTGYNGFARGIDETERARWERPLKYDFVTHAERNAIYNSARHGSATKGCTLYITGAPCKGCAIAIIQAGIVAVVYRKQSQFTDRQDWADNMAFARAMLDEAGVEVREVD